MGGQKDQNLEAHRVKKTFQIIGHMSYCQNTLYFDKVIWMVIHIFNTFCTLMASTVVLLESSLKVKVFGHLHMDLKHWYTALYTYLTYVNVCDVVIVLENNSSPILHLPHLC